jgi:site-specific DNA recombinase
MLTFAQFERELASERIRDKFAQRAQRGLYNGGRPPYGYKKENGKLVVDFRRARVVRFIFEKYVELGSAHQVTLALRDSWHERTTLSDSFVWRVLKNPVVAGKVSYKGKILPGVHSPIISETLFNHVQGLLAQETQEAKRPGPSYHHLPIPAWWNARECRSNMSVSFTDKKTRREAAAIFIIVARQRTTKVGTPAPPARSALPGWRRSSTKTSSDSPGTRFT